MSNNYTNAERAPFRFAYEGQNPDLLNFGTSVSNGFTRRAQGYNATGGAATNPDIDIWATDSNGNLLFGGQRTVPFRGSVPFYLAPSALQATQAFWISDNYYYISGASLSFATANGAALTAQIVIDRGVGAPGSGSNGGGSIMSNTFNLNGTANTPQLATLATLYGRRTLAQAEQTVNAYKSAIVLCPGDRLSLVLSTAVTSLAGVVVSLQFAPSNVSNVYSFFQNANAQIATQPFDIVTRNGLTVTGISVYYATAGSTSGSLTLNVTADANGTAAGSGTALLASAISLKQTAGTVYNGTLSATAANLILGATNRLSIVITGTTTALAGLVVCVYTTPTLSQEASFQQTSNTNLGTATSFAGPFDRDYELVDTMVSWETAGSGTVTLYADAPGTTPGGGTAVISAQAVTGAASTAVDATLAARSGRILPAGYRLSIGFGGTKGSLAGVCANAVLLPR
jgi:hypothetical protein